MAKFFFWGKTDTRDYNVQTSAGTFPKQTNLHRASRNPELPNGSYADVWSYGETQAAYTWPTVNDNFRIRAGGSINDDAAGSHARAVELVYLNDLGAKVTETIATAGAAASALSSQVGRRLIRAKVVGVGTRDVSNDLDILIEQANGTLVGVISAGKGQTQMSHYTVPKGYKAFLKDGYYMVTGSKLANVRAWVRPGAYIDAAPFGARKEMLDFSEVGGFLPFEDNAPREIPELSDIWFEAAATGTGTAISVHYDLELVKL